jgi:hypothetical protein
MVKMVAVTISGHFAGTFNITETEKGFEFLYDTPMPISLSPGAGLYPGPKRFCRR